MIVTSPLIALMKDQVRLFNQKGYARRTLEVITVAATLKKKLYKENIKCFFLDLSAYFCPPNGEKCFCPPCMEPD